MENIPISQAFVQNPAQDSSRAFVPLIFLPLSVCEVDEIFMRVVCVLSSWISNCCFRNHFLSSDEEYDRRVTDRVMISWFYPWNGNNHSSVVSIKAELCDSVLVWHSQKQCLHRGPTKCVVNLRHHLRSDVVPPRRRSFASHLKAAKFFTFTESKDNKKLVFLHGRGDTANCLMRNT